MSWLPDERPRFAWLTNNGELILFDELLSEVHGTLSRHGVKLDIWPLTCTLHAIREVTEKLLQTRPARPPSRSLPTPDELCILVRDALRRQRTVLALDVIRAVLAAYLDQLRRLDIARVHYF